MALVKETEVGSIEVVTEYKHIQVRTDTVVKEDGKELSRKYHRHVVHCGTIDGSDNFVDTDISGEDATVRAVADVVWTQAVKDAWKAYLIANKVPVKDSSSE
tara:strand:+ start:134 stop:439 length:306 start_codon:yes stop_codon:yes gene_type:complete